MARNLEHEVEALLFSSPAPLHLGEISGLLEAPALEADQALEKLVRRYSKGGALEIRESRKGMNRAFSMEVREAYRRVASRILPPAMDREILETLGLIALNQPVTQAALARSGGPTVHDHIRELESKDLVKKRRSGRTYMLRTTPSFARQFGLADDPGEIRRAMRERVSGSLPRTSGL